MARGFWTDTRIAQLKRLWRAGRTAGAIGRELGGISRAAVLGKLFRLRLAAADDERDADADPPARRRARKVMPVNDSRPARPRRRTLFELTNLAAGGFSSAAKWVPISRAAFPIVRATCSAPISCRRRSSNRCTRSSREQQ
jgi:hypothetical protein